jgi:phenylalanyl-tRNA synthetase beta chain
MIDIDNEVYFAELSWNMLIKDLPKEQIKFNEISKFPEAKRDLALLVDKNVTFADIKKIAIDSERKLLKNIVLFDVYEGKNLMPDKKSYAVSFYLQDKEKTLNDIQIDSIMSKIQKNLEDKLGIQLR